ncbi:MAG: sigma-70 family RNA polymerase sigma factor [Eubacteriales bacterium]|nr:sigma-70 family RNA polymerase sigma factor [Eubacteriales bacterium]
MLIYLTMLDDPAERTLFETVYRKYRNLMFYIANSILKDDHLAEDAVHNAFLKLLNHMDAISDPDSTRAKNFLALVCERTAIDLYKSTKRGKEISIDEIEENRSVFGTEMELGNPVYDAVMNLPFLYREVMMYKFIQGYENDEISRMLGIPEGTVRQRISRGKQRLKKMLEEENGNDG